MSSGSSGKRVMVPEPSLSMFCLIRRIMWWFSVEKSLVWGIFGGVARTYLRKLRSFGEISHCAKLGSLKTRVS
jgi:hypothetical protein